MKAVVFRARGDVALADLADPRPGPGEVVIEVRASGLCHTDLEVLRGNYGTSAWPVVPGHEYAGVVVELADDVTNLATGDRVVVDPNLECGTCRACRRGLAHLCEDLHGYGVTQNGGFAQRSVIAAHALHPIGDLPFAVAALAEPMGCVLNGLAAARAETAETALIFGAGPMGLLLAVALRARGLAEVTLVDIDEARLDLIGQFGFRAVASGSAECAGTRADLVIDATGRPEVAAALPRHAHRGGSCLFFGVCPAEAEIAVSPFDVFRRQLTLAGSHSLNHNIPEALGVIATCRDDLERLVSHRVPLSEIAAILASSPPRGSLKVQAVPAEHDRPGDVSP